MIYISDIYGNIKDYYDEIFIIYFYSRDIRLDEMKDFEFIDDTDFSDKISGNTSLQYNIDYVFNLITFKDVETDVIYQEDIILM